MGPIASIQSVAPTAGSTRPGLAQSRAEGGAAPPCLPVAPAPSASSASRGNGERPLAAFLTHLIATAHDAPQTRRLRRAPLSDAVSAYAATAALISGGGAGSGVAGCGRAA